jgi:hypothetical protein
MVSNLFLLLLFEILKNYFGTIQKTLRILLILVKAKSNITKDLDTANKHIKWLPKAAWVNIFSQICIVTSSFW